MYVYGMIVLLSFSSSSDKFVLFKAFIIINKFLMFNYCISSGNNRSAQNNSKAGPANKSLTVGTSIRQARRNVVRT